MKNLEIPAIHDKDLRAILEKYHLAKKIDNGEVSCPICDTQITWDNISALRIIDNQIEVYCDEPDCIENISNQ